MTCAAVPASRESQPFKVVLDMRKEQAENLYLLWLPSLILQESVLLKSDSVECFLN